MQIDSKYIKERSKSILTFSYWQRILTRVKSSPFLNLMTTVGKRFELAVNLFLKLFLKQKSSNNDRERVFNNDLVLHD